MLFFFQPFLLLHFCLKKLSHTQFLFRCHFVFAFRCHSEFLINLLSLANYLYCFRVSLSNKIPQFLPSFLFFYFSVILFFFVSFSLICGCFFLIFHSFFFAFSLSITLFFFFDFTFHFRIRLFHFRFFVSLFFNSKFNCISAQSALLATMHYFTPTISILSVFELASAVKCPEDISST